MAKDFLLEVGTEPLPARFVAPALEQLAERLAAALREARFSFSACKTAGTLRRLAVTVEGLSEKSPPLVEKVYGPPAGRLRDETGAFSAAASGFARKHGLSPEQLKTEATPRGELLVAERRASGEDAAVALARLLPAALTALEFPKTLEWEPSRFRFGRPIRSITALYGKRPVAFSLAGIESGRTVWGLPALGRKAALAEPSKYRATLKRLLVVVDPAERRELLLERLAAAARAASARLDLDSELLRETVYMTENPVPIVGRFRREFLELPQPLLSLVLKKQLKFFPLLDDKGGLVPAFVGVRDGLSEGEQLVREGYERVLAARCNDALFFFGRDKGSRLEGKLPRLSTVGYQRGLGTMAEKAARVVELSRRLCERLRPERPLQERSAAEIARLCYADLVTEVVREFPELQGAMGGVYARHDGYDERVALGLEQFYFPTSGKSPVPATEEGALVSLAGKLDSLAGSFATGAQPTGSADPLALRRQALGALRICLEKQFPLDLEAAFAEALSLQPVQLDGARRATLAAGIAEFVWTRAQSFFEELGYRVDEVRSVRPGALSHLPRALLRLAAVHAVRRHPDFEALAAAFKRASNILRQARVSPGEGVSLDPGLLREAAERRLYDALASLEGQVGERLAQNAYEDGLRALVVLKPRLDEFFDSVMVMVDDEALRVQRLGLLARLVRLFDRVADLSALAPN